MADQVPVRKEQHSPATQEGEVLPAWREPRGMFGDVDTVFDRMVRNFFGPSMPAWPSTFVPAVDIEETSDAYIFEIELPGLSRDDMKVEAGQNELHISGQIVERERTGIVRHRTRRTGQFSYRVALPTGTDPDRVSATYKDGVLTVTVPRSALTPRSWA